MLGFFKKKNADSEATQSVPSGEKSSAEGRGVPNTGPADIGDPEELIAVITAAVAASLNRSTHNITVRSVRRIPAAPAWNQAARHDLTDGKIW